MNEYFPTLTSDEVASIRGKFREVFSGTVGVEVLALILDDLGYFDRPETDHDRVLHAYAHRFMSKWFAAHQAVDRMRYVEAMLSVAPSRED